jgi:putative nucleotidyltransferase with HDIG domain
MLPAVHVVRPAAVLLVKALEMRDAETARHSRRTARYALMLGRALIGCRVLCASDMPILVTGALLHDIGKIALPDKILHKVGALTSGERETMQEHPGIGHALLSEVPLIPEAVLSIVRHHHERWDGEGYPDRLPGSCVPLLTRIVSLADAYDAITSKRSYQAARPHAAACLLLRRGAGTQFDPGLVQHFLDIPLEDWPAELLPAETDETRRAA